MRGSSASGRRTTRRDPASQTLACGAARLFSLLSDSCARPGCGCRTDVLPRSGSPFVVRQGTVGSVKRRFEGGIVRVARCRLASGEAPRSRSNRGYPCGSVGSTACRRFSPAAYRLFHSMEPSSTVHAMTGPRVNHWQRRRVPLRSTPHIARTNVSDSSTSRTTSSRTLWTVYSDCRFEMPLDNSSDLMVESVPAVVPTCISRSSTQLRVTSRICTTWPSIGVVTSGSSASATA
jgi:hypothetical protein